MIIEKKCKKCGTVKTQAAFSKAPSNKDGYVCICKACVSERNKTYWRTPTGRMAQIFSGQQQVSKERSHPPPTYTKDEFFKWMATNGFLSLHATWERSDYQKDLIPSVDRLDPTQGYSLSNIRLVTWQENNDKAYADRKSCAHVTKQNRRIEQRTTEGNHIAYFDSIASAARSTGIGRTNINGMCAGKKYVHSVGGFIWQYA